MKFKKLVNVLDPLTTVIIWTQEDEDKPSYEGILLDVPWHYLKYKIGRVEKKSDEPVYVFTRTRKSYYNRSTQITEPVVVINLIAK